MKEKLQKNLEKLKKEIYSNSKDVKYAEKLVTELLSVKKKLDVTHTELNVGKKLDEWKGETFSIVKTDRGILYNEHGHYAIFVDPQLSLYSFLADIIDNKDEYAKLEGETKEQFELFLSGLTYCIGVPKFMVFDSNFMFKIAGYVVEYLTNLQEELLNKELQEETPIENAEFEQAVKAMSELQKDK